MTEKKNPYYVYSHFDPRTNEILYVGMGKGSRAYATKTVKTKQANYGHRSPEHSTHLDILLDEGYIPHEWIKFHYRDCIKEDALELEKLEQKELKPKYNRKFGAKILKFDLKDIKKIWGLRNQGLSYKNIAKEMGCSIMVAHRILNNKSPNYKEMLDEARQ